VLPANVEIKARVQDWETLRQRVDALAGPPNALLCQEDTFFRTPQGRLKLRILAPDHGQLIYYERPDRAGPKTSHYILADTTEPHALGQVLSEALGVRGVVRKQRWLYWVGHTRVHLDQVEGLGDFVELEVVLQPGQGDDDGLAVARDLMAKLGIQEEDLVQGAYMDLLDQ
jgi:predicted adenylyl cyclase CyaB